MFVCYVCTLKDKNGNPGIHWPRQIRQRQASRAGKRARMAMLKTGYWATLGKSRQVRQKPPKTGTTKQLKSEMQQKDRNPDIWRQLHNLAAFGLPRWPKKQPKNTTKRGWKLVLTLASSQRSPRPPPGTRRRGHGRPVPPWRRGFARRPRHWQPGYI